MSNRAGFELYMKSESGLVEGVSPYVLKKKNNAKLAEWSNTCAKLAISTTVYVGNLAFFTTEEQIFEYFSTVGDVKRVIMGINRNTKIACGFCFVEFFDHESAVAARMYLDGSTLNLRPIHVDIDEGFESGREFGKSKTGGQVRDAFREGVDVERGDSLHSSVVNDEGLKYGMDLEETGRDRDYRTTA